MSWVRGPARGLRGSKTAPAAYFRAGYQLPAKSTAGPACSQSWDKPSGAGLGARNLRCSVLPQSLAKTWSTRETSGNLGTESGWFWATGVLLGKLSISCAGASKLAIAKSSDPWLFGEIVLSRLASALGLP